MARPITEQTLRLIRESEGCRLEPYRDPVGLWTVGYGHLAASRRGDPKPKPVTQEEAERLLALDAEGAGLAVEALIRVPLTGGQFAALVDFTFNMGQGKLRDSTLRRVLNGGNYDAVPDQLRLWVLGRVDGVMVKLAGLMERREREIEFWNMKEKEDGSS